MTFDTMLTSETMVDGSAGNIIKAEGGLTINVSGTIGVF